MSAEMAEELTRRAQGVRDNIAEAVAHRAHEVEAYAKGHRRAAKSESRRRPTARPRRLHVL